MKSLYNVTMVKTVLIILALSFISAFVYFLTRQKKTKILPVLMIFFFGMVFGYFVPMSISNVALLERLVENLLPATLFLLMIDFDIRTLFRNAVGCSCKMGTKRYWLVVALGIVASLLSQAVGEWLYPSFGLLIAGSFSFFIGWLASLTPLRYLNGTQEVATTMLYLLVSVSGALLAA